MTVEWGPMSTPEIPKKKVYRSKKLWLLVIVALVVALVVSSIISVFYPHLSSVSHKTKISLQLFKPRALEYAFGELEYNGEIDTVALRKEAQKLLAVSAESIMFEDPDSGPYYDWLSVPLRSKNDQVVPCFI